MDLSKLALSGLLGGALAVTAGCSGGEATTEEAPATEQAAPAAAEPAAAKPAEVDHSKMDHSKMKMDKGQMEGQAASAEIHDCAGKNACKGVGGCAVTEDQLKKLAEAAGMDMSAAGEAHDCAGKNACKGLGGCAVDEKKLAKINAGKEKAD